MSKSNWILLIAVVAVILVIFVGGRYMYYSRPNGSAYTPPNVELAEVNLDVAARPNLIEAVDNPAQSDGVIVVDYNHNNALFIEELNLLLSKLVTRGYGYEIVLNGEDDSEENGGNGLAGKLRYADALILPLPRAEYSDEEVAQIEQFVEKGGRVLIIGDPTRTVVVEALNSIAGAFGIIYANDYLYSLDNNDNNYRNVVYTEFNDSPVTKGLGESDKVIFYSSSSVNAPGDEIILGDETVHSSRSEGGRAMAAAALTTNDQVLAVGDLTFMNEPYSAVESNGILINNIADFLAGGERNFNLQDFPFFFNKEIDVVFDDPLVFNSQFEDAVKVKDFLEQGGQRTVNFTDSINSTNDVIYVGRFGNVEAVEDYLDAASIVLIEESDENNGDEEMLAETETSGEDLAEDVALVSDTPPDADQDFVEGRIQIAGVGELEMGGSTLFYRHQDDGRNVFVILSDNPDTNADAFELLLEHEYTNCLAGPNVAVCQTEEPDKRQLPTIRSTRIDKVLVVSDDDGREREDAQTSALEYNNALSSTYKITIWETSKDGSPDLTELQEYDAIIWTTGDYWDDSIGDEDAEVLTQYIEAGGNLVLSGASIAFDWDHTDFLTNIAHADYLTFAEQADIETAIEDHPLARGFDEGDAITFVETPSGETLEPDVVDPTPNARVIFKRGPDSDQEGAAAVIAYEDDRSKIAYFAFPVYLLPEPDRATLLGNTLDWFTRKPLDLPDEDDFEPFDYDGSDKKESSDDAEGEESESGEEGSDGENGEGNGSDEEGNGNGNGENGNGDGENGGEEDSENGQS